MDQNERIRREVDAYMDDPVLMRPWILEVILEEKARILAACPDFDTAIYDNAERRLRELIERDNRVLVESNGQRETTADL